MDKLIVAAIVMFLAAGAIAAMGNQPTVFPLAGTEHPSPAERLGWDKITVTEDGVFVEVPYATLVALADTNSMDPTLDAESKVITIRPQSPDEIIVGDIISFRFGDIVIIHRVIETGYDSEGWYAITKGDNNAFDDGKIRWEQVERLLIGIIY